MKVIELLKSKEWSGKVIDCVLRFALSFALALAQVFGGYAPLALGMIGASGAGLRGASALIGASAGAVLFLPFSHALRTFAAGVLIFTANNAFFDLKLYKKRAFLPLLCAGMMFSVEFVYVLRDGVGEAANCLMALLLCALGAMSGRALLATGDREKEDHPYAPLFILLGVLMAASSFETADGFALNVTVTNTGKAAGKEVVQAYLQKSEPHDHSAVPDRPGDNHPHRNVPGITHDRIKAAPKHSSVTKM